MTIPRRTPRAPQLLLDGEQVSSALAQLLADASAPAHPDELEGLSAAVVAFTTSRPLRRRPPATSSILAKVLAAKLLVAAAGATALGGVALAAATAALPVGPQNFAHDVLGAPAHHSAGAFVSRQAPATTASPSPSLVGLCQAYQAEVATAPGRAISNPAFAALSAAAGGADQVLTYCGQLVATPDSGAPPALPPQATTHRPATAGRPKVDHSTSAPTDHSTSAPTDHSTSAPTDHSTSAPADHSTSAPADHFTSAPATHSMSAPHSLPTVARSAGQPSAVDTGAPAGRP